MAPEYWGDWGKRIADARLHSKTSTQKTKEVCDSLEGSELISAPGGVARCLLFLMVVLGFPRTLLFLTVVLDFPTVAVLCLCLVRRTLGLVPSYQGNLGSHLFSVFWQSGEWCKICKHTPYHIVFIGRHLLKASQRNSDKGYLSQFSLLILAGK